MSRAYLPRPRFRFRRYAAPVGFLALFLFFVVSLLPALHGRFTRDELVLPAMVALIVVVGSVSFRRHQYRSCREIRLSADGTCEFETRAETIRLHENEIMAVTYHSPAEAEDYATIYYRGGELYVSRRMIGFPDFFMRLKTLNRAIELSDGFLFLADAWQG